MGNVTAVSAVDVSVVENAPDVASVDPSARVNVADVVGAVMATLLTLVAVATPIVGVVNVGDVAKTAAPVPVSSLNEPNKSNEANEFDAVPYNVPEVGNVMVVSAVDVSVVENAPDVTMVDPSASVNVADVAGAVMATLFTLVAVATPMFGVVNVGDVAKTANPLPVSSDNNVVRSDDALDESALRLSEAEINAIHEPFL